MALMSAPNASMQQSGSNWQRSDPMAYRHCQNDSTLAQWRWGSSGAVAAVIFQGDRATLITTLLKCSASTCAHWRPFSWWRSRRPPSSPMPRNGTGLEIQDSLSCISFCKNVKMIIIWCSCCLISLHISPIFLWFIYIVTFLTLKGSYDAFLKIIILCIWCNRICWHILLFKKTHYFSNTVHYCRSSMPRLSQTLRFLQSPSFWQVQSALIGQLAQCIVIGWTSQAASEM